MAIVVVGFVLGGWDLAEFAVKASVVEPLNVGESLDLDVLGVAPGAASSSAPGVCAAATKKPQLRGKVSKGINRENIACWREVSYKFNS